MLDVGLIGCGVQALQHYVPLLLREIASGNVRVRWISGYLPTDPRRSQIEAVARELECECAPEPAWRGWLPRVDAVIISLPNSLHTDAIRAALEAGDAGLHVAVDKPTTICPDECEELVRLADRRNRVFVTISQRRYEEVYQTIRDAIERGEIGNIGFAQYSISHPYFDRGRTTWTTSRTLAGGGSLIQSGYHGLDTLLWLFHHVPERFGGPPTVAAVSAECRYEAPIPTGEPRRQGQYTLASVPTGDQVESFASVRLRLTNGAIFELSASYANPVGSLDEDFKIVGDGGMIRFARERPVMMDLRAGNLSYQDAVGNYREYDTSRWLGNRAAPLTDFLVAATRCKAGEPWSVLAPASESVETLRVIDGAYRSAREGGREVILGSSVEPRPVHHVAIQTAHYQEALRFYTEILGMRILQDGPFKRRTVAWLQAGNTRVELFSKRTGDELLPWSELSSGPIHLAFEVENLRAFLVWARERGAVLHPTHPEPFVPPIPDAREIAYLLGPDGEEVEVRERD